MYEKKIIRETVSRVTDARSRLLIKYPFFGQLVMHLSVALAPVETAATDMRRLYFDPDFTAGLSPEELEFVLMHEVMHCVLKHCIRGRSYDRELFNIACDIVVNSNILSVMGREQFQVAGLPVMHLAPDGKEGCLYTAEKVYEMLFSGIMKGRFSVSDSQENGCVDNHTVWDSLSEGSAGNGMSRSDADALSDRWDHLLNSEWQKMKNNSHSPVPPSVREVLYELEERGRIDWRRALAEFIQLNCSHYDYSYIPSDRRFAWLDYAVPAFSEQETEEVENLWFVVDASGSVSDEMLNAFYREIREAISQFQHLSGFLSFFSTQITEPAPFESVEDLKQIRPYSDGGTDYYPIFRYLKQHMAQNLPAAILIMTDGFASYPPETDAMGIPVMWILSCREHLPDWGKVLDISGEF